VTQPTPLDYAAWSRSRLGRVTERLELQSVLRAVGDVAGKDVLDVGCGDGRYTIALARRGARVVGLDPSDPALQTARGRAGDAGVKVFLAEGDARSIPFASETFDIVTAVTVLCFVKAPEKAFGEVERVLRPEGLLVVVELARWSTWAAWRRLRGWSGNRTWASATFWTPGRLRTFARGGGLVPGKVEGSVFHPPVGWIASLLSPLDQSIGRVTTSGSAFLVLRARKPGLDKPGATGVISSIQ